MMENMTPEFVAAACGQTLADPVDQLFAALAIAAPSADVTLSDALQQAAALQQQRWYETMLRQALPAAVRTGSVKHLERVRAHFAKLPLSEAFLRQAGETAAVQGAAAGCVEAVMALVADAPDESMKMAASTAAAAAGRITVLQALLDDGLNDDALTRALIAAAAGGNLGAVTALLLAAGERAGNVAQADCGGITAIGAAARLGALDVVRELWPWQGTTTRAAALVNAASEGSQTVVNWILVNETVSEAQDPSEAKIWRAGLAQALRAAAAAGHLPIVQAVLARLGASPTLASLEEAFFAAAASGHADVMKCLLTAAGTRSEELLAARADGVLQVAANAGHVEAMRFILDAVGSRRQAVLRAEDDGAFCSAAAQGHVDAVNCLLAEVQPQERAEMVGAYQWEPLREAAAGGHLAMVQRLLELLAEQASDAVQEADYEAFRRAASGGHTDVVQHFLDQAGDNTANMLGARAFAALRGAAGAGHGPTLRLLLNALGDKAHETLAEGAGALLQAAAKSGDLDLLVELLGRMPKPDDAAMQHLGTLWMSSHFLAMPGEPERHAPVRKHMALLQAWAPGLNDNLRKHALSVATADGEPELAALFC